MKNSLNIQKDIIKVFDPVGAGVNTLRNETALEFYK